MSPEEEIVEKSVFINVPFDKGYERLFVSLIASLVSLGRIPRCVLEIPERGQGRLIRIQDLLESCRVSIHDLCRIGTPVRFNMPFELGLACSLSRYSGPHFFILFDKKEYCLVRTLTDLGGCDPYIHKGSMRGIVNSVLDSLASEINNPDPRSVWRLAIELWKVASRIKQRNRRDSVFYRTAFLQLVSAGTELATNQGFISP